MSRTFDGFLTYHTTLPVRARESSDSRLDCCAAGIRHRTELGARYAQPVGRTRDPCHRDEVLQPIARASRTILTPPSPAFPGLVATTRSVSVAHTMVCREAGGHPRGYRSIPLLPARNVLHSRARPLPSA